MDVFLRLTTGECKEHVHMGRIALCGRQEMPYFKGIPREPSLTFALESINL